MLKISILELRFGKIVKALKIMKSYSFSNAKLLAD